MSCSLRRKRQGSQGRADAQASINSQVIGYKERVLLSTIENEERIVLTFHMPKISNLIVLRTSFAAWLLIGLFFILAALSWLIGA